MVATGPISNKSKTEAAYPCQKLGKDMNTIPDPRAGQWERLQVKGSI